MANREAPKLNMEHGFIHHIIKNQIDRDEYDKEQKFVKMQQRDETPGRPRREKRAAQAVYVPPHQRKTDEMSQTSNILLEIEFEGKDGNISYLTIHKGEDIREAIRSFAEKEELDGRLKEALYLRIQQELR